MPSDFPVSTPSAHPTKVASISPSISHQPSVNPTARPSFVGSNRLTISSSPSMIPTNLLTLAPTSSPTKSPTPNPTIAPTNAPSSSPTSSPTAAPTKYPTPNPTIAPTNAPSSSPTSSPTAAPTSIPIQSVPVTEPTTSDNTDFQCCFDLQTLSCRVDWCGESEYNCGGCGITVKWMEAESSCMPLYADCSTDTDACCGSTSCVQQGMECPGDGSYCQCLLSTENPISISYVNFDGAVANTESDEYVEISSNSNNLIDISGYYVYVATTGKKGPTFYFPEGTILASHSVVKVYTDEVHEDSGGFSFGSGKVIWNNAAGHAILKNSSDEIVAEYEYESTSSPTVAPTKSPTRPQIDTNGISITNIFYDGLVPRSESDEYMEISNDCEGAIDITGFYVYVDNLGEQGATFVFPEGTVLDVVSSVRVYTDEIHEESGGFSFGSGRAIWNNGGGVGILKDNNDELVSEYSYP